MLILVTGSRGLIGTALVSYLTGRGHTVRRLVHAEPSVHIPGEPWDSASGTLDSKALEGVEAVVHLAGESLAGGRWSVEKKRRIRDSRVLGTRLLSERLAQIAPKPRVLLSASASGYYGGRGDEILREESPPGAGFLAALCREWEAATAAAAEAGIRVVLLRMGIVLSPEGGALGRMLPAFQRGFGGRVGHGDQFWSWISIHDVVGAIDHLIHKESLEGPINLASPNPVTNREFSAILARVLDRMARFPVPAFLLRLALGELADSLLLASARMEPAKLVAGGYAFRHPDLEGALRALLARA